MTAEIIHLAGPMIQFGSVCRQRCAWCGALIQERDLERVAIQESSREPDKRGKPLEPDELGWWEGFVGVDGSVKFAVGEPDDHTAPGRSCMRLLPDQT